MLKGDVFKNQIFENHIFALFINLFMNNADGVAREYKNAMNITYSGHNVTINRGACLVQGRLLEEDSSTTIDAGIETMFCKLVVEIDLDKVNTSSVFNQGYYNIVKSANSYPNLTQEDIIGQNSGKYQYELARFKISDGVITDFEDKRTYIEDLLQYGEINNLITVVNNNYNTLKEDSFYYPGEFFRATDGLTCYPGYITNSKDSIKFTIVLPKKIHSSVREIDIYSMKLIIRLANGGYIPGFPGETTYDFYTDVNNVYMYDNLVVIDINTPTDIDPTGEVFRNRLINNSPIVVSPSDLKLKFLGTN